MEDQGAARSIGYPGAYPLRPLPCLPGHPTCVEEEVTPEVGMLRLQDNLGGQTLEVVGGVAGAGLRAAKTIVP